MDSNLASVVLKWSIQQDYKHKVGSDDLLAKLLVVVTARNYFFNSFAGGGVYIHAVRYWEWTETFVTESSKLQLKLLSRIPNKSGMRMILLEMELEHASILVLDYSNNTFFVADPTFGCKCYVYAVNTIVPILLDILGTEWKYNNEHATSATCTGPMYRTEDNYCYAWSLLVAYTCLDVDDVSRLFSDLDTLSIAELKELIERFMSSMYSVLADDGSAEVFRLINVNKEGHCFLVIDHLVDTMCSVKYYKRDMSPADFMQRYTEELANIERGRNLANLSSS